MATLTQATFKQLVDTLDLGEYRNTILNLAWPSIRTQTVIMENDEVLPGTSRLGGLPDLPSGSIWPRWRDKALSFVAQVNMADIKNLDVDNIFPDMGLLSFFYNQYQWLEGEPFGQDMWQVIFTSLDSTSLEPLPAPPNFGENRLYPSCRLTFQVEITLPPFESYYGFKHLGYTYQHGIDTKLKLLYDRIWDLMMQDQDHCRSRLLGHPDQIQGDIFLEAYSGSLSKTLDLVSTSIYDDTNTAITEWVLLFQLDSEDQAKMMWGDVGRLYYCIRKEDLRSLAFDKVICTMQCS